VPAPAAGRPCAERAPARPRLRRHRRGGQALHARRPRDRARQEGGAGGVGHRGRGCGLLQVRCRGRAGLRALPRARPRGKPGHERVRGRAAHARHVAPRGLGGRHRPALDRDRFRRRPAPRRGGRAAARRPAGRRVIDHAALYLATPDDLTAALAPVAGQPLAFRVIAAAVRAADAALAAALAPALAEGTPLGDDLDRALKSRDVRAVAEGWYVLARDARGVAEAEARLYAALGSPIDTRLDVVLHRRLSFHVTRAAVWLGVTPNAISVASFLVGLVAVWCFWRASQASA